MTGVGRWRSSRLKFVADLKSGGTPAVDADSYWAEGDEGVAWVTISDMTRSSRIFSTTRTLTPEGLAASRLAVACPGTLLLSMYASLGTVATLEIPAAWNQAILGITPKAGTDRGFLRYALSALQPSLRGLARSSTQDNLNAEQIGNLSLRRPSVDMQCKIGQLLDRESARIDVLKASLHDLQDEMITPVLSCLSELCAGSPKGRVGYRYEVQLGKMLDQGRIDPGDHHPYLRNRNVQWDHILPNDLKTMPFSSSEQARYRLRKGDLLVCEGGQPGRAAIWQGEVENCFFQKALMRVRARGGDSTRFLMWCLRLSSERGDFAADGTGATIMHLPAERLIATRVPLPSPREQRELVAQVDELAEPAGKLAAEIGDLIAGLEEYRNALITEAVTEKLDVTKLSDQQLDESARAAMEGERPEVLSA